MITVIQYSEKNQYRNNVIDYNLEPICTSYMKQKVCKVDLQYYTTPTI